MSERSPEVRIDISTGQILIGQLAVEQHIEAGGHPADIYDPANPEHVGYLITYPETLPKVFPSPEQKYTRPRLIKYGQTLAEFAQPHLQEDHRTLNRHIIDQAGRLGMGPYSRTIGGVYGTVSQYYKKLGLGNLHTIDTQAVIQSPRNRNAMIEYLREIGAEIGKRPTERELIKRHAEDTANPSLHIIARRFGSLANALELAGFCAPYAWQPEDFVNWGVKFMKANDGWVPTRVDLDSFSKKGLGPGASTTILHFNNAMSQFQDEVMHRYDKDLADETSRKQRLLEEAVEGIESGDLPKELFEDTASDYDMCVRLAKYKLLGELSDLWTAETKVLISTHGYAGRDFVQSIRKYNNSITKGDVETTALYLDVLDYVSPPDTSYMETLKIEIKPKRKRITRSPLTLAS